MTTQDERTFEASPSEVPAMRHWIEEVAEKASFSRVRPDLALAVTEAASNAIRHSRTDRLTIRWAAVQDHAVIEVADEGIFVRQAVSPDGLGGYGVPMMAALMDEITIEQGTPSSPGTKVRLVKMKPSNGPSDRGSE